MRLWKFRINEEWEGKTVEQVLRGAGFSKKEISRLKFKTPGILLDGSQCRSTQVVISGQEVILHLEDVSEVLEITLENNMQESWEICYEDADLMIVKKPSGLSCHPGRGHYNENLGSQIQAYCRRQGESNTIRLVGRLDKDTSGFVVYAKNQIAAARLWKQQEEGVLQKKYCAFVHGIPNPHSGTINSSIKASVEQKNRMMVSSDGMCAKTNYTVKSFLFRNAGTWRECEWGDSKAEASLVEFRLKTGRTHQIRVHMASIGHPVMGDSIYGIPDAAERLCLHAYEITLYQPFTNKKIYIKDGIPF